MKSNITGKAAITINVPALKVWEALITPSIIKQYFFGTDAISDWKVGSPLIFKGEWQGKKYEDKGTILDIIPQKLFKYSYWSSMSGIEDKPENYVNVAYELSGNNDTTTLTVTQENIPDEKTKEHSEENWRKVIGDLKKLLVK
ncbi:MAG TPA: SRPBCC family protein [Chitinophagaceae bacterium]